MAHGDYTGTTKAQLARAAAEEQQFAASRMAMVTEAVQTAQQGTVDLFTHEDRAYLDFLKSQVSEEGVHEIPVEVQQQREEWSPVKFRASEDLDDITVGQDRHFSLRAGQTYVAPRWVAAHLDQKSRALH